MHKIFICMLIFICHVTLSIYSYAFENNEYYNSNGLKISKAEYDERCAKQSLKFFGTETAFKSGFTKTKRFPGRIDCFSKIHSRRT